MVCSSVDDNVEIITDNLQHVLQFLVARGGKVDLVHQICLDSW